MLTVGLTGSIAVGKSFVCSVFRELGCHVLDADLTAREVVTPGSDGLAKVVQAFGAEVVTPAGELDRKKLGAVIFADEKKRELLNSILHPLIIEAQDRWISDVRTADPTGVVIVDAALMIESGGYRRFDKLIVVWCDPDIQLQRLRSREDLDETAAKARIALQMPQEEKKRFADYLIDTSAGFDDARKRTIDVFNHMQVIAGKA
ncbi:MAG: dephospho-CoA kinase [Pyrinomonadaceae bacterium]